MSQIRVHTCLQLSSKSSGRWSQMKWVTGETGSSTPVRGNTKMEAEEVLSSLVGWSSTDAVSNSCLFPQPPFLIIPPSPVSQRHVIYNIPNHIYFPPSFSKPNRPQYLPLCLLSKGEMSHLLLPYSHSTEMEKSNMPLIPTTELPFAGMCHGLF